jgi:hypothetical protein
MSEKTINYGDLESQAVMSEKTINYKVVLLSEKTINYKVVLLSEKTINYGDLSIQATFVRKDK